MSGERDPAPPANVGRLALARSPEGVSFSHGAVGKEIYGSDDYKYCPAANCRLYLIPSAGIIGHGAEAIADVPTQMLPLVQMRCWDASANQITSLFHAGANACTPQRHPTEQVVVRSKYRAVANKRRTMCYTPFSTSRNLARGSTPNHVWCHPNG